MAAHIAQLMVCSERSSGLHNYVAKDLSPQTSNELMAGNTPVEEKGKERFVWRMHQPTETRKYQLFPTKDKLSISPGRNSPDPEQALALALSQSSNPSERPVGTAMRLKAKETSLIRRRKPSVSDLGPMTTVQEVSMDSPTIPGRPPLHERSSSAPGANLPRRNGSGVKSKIDGLGLGLSTSTESRVVVEAVETSGVGSGEASSSTKRPLSPRTLTPLVIPTSMTSYPQRTAPNPQPRTQIDSPTDTPPNVPPKSARMFENNFSPMTRTPYTPMSGSVYTPLTSSTINLSIPSTATTATPLSSSEGRISPFAGVPITRGLSPRGHARGQSDCSDNRMSQYVAHRRERSEASMTERGRPKKRPDGSPMKLKRSTSKQTQLAEQKAFEMLPEGVKAVDAPAKFEPEELEALKKQAIGQLAKFEVLGMKDVDSLSRELRALDERCEYLRKTNHSLRAGRRNLHERICTYLRSPRTAQFSHTSLLKQEEALIELDLSIDDWVSKLEHAENRRTRVRQKLLEHVAAALTIPTPSSENKVQRCDGRDQIIMTTLALNRHVSMGDDTPPRSPTKEQVRADSPTPSASPQRLALPLRAQTQALQSSAVYDAEALRRSKESIRIYADSDVYALLADVEEEMNRMGVVEEEPLETLSASAFSGPVSSRSASPLV